MNVADGAAPASHRDERQDCIRHRNGGQDERDRPGPRLALGPGDAARLPAPLPARELGGSIAATKDAQGDDACRVSLPEDPREDNVHDAVDERAPEELVSAAAAGHGVHKIAVLDVAEAHYCEGDCETGGNGGGHVAAVGVELGGAVQVPGEHVDRADADVEHLAEDGAAEDLLVCEALQKAHVTQGYDE